MPTGYSKRILDAAFCGIYVYDLTAGRNEYINPQYTRITGWTLVEINAMSAFEFSELFHPDDRVAVYEHMNQVVETSDDEVFEIEYRFRHKNGSWIWCLSRDALMEGDETTSRFIGTFIDVTERHLADRALRDSPDDERQILLLSYRGTLLGRRGRYADADVVLRRALELAIKVYGDPSPSVANQLTNLAVVAPGIAEALFATGLGLLAAIPALIFYNKLTADSDGIAAGLADQISAPVVAAVGEPGMCNANANFVPTLLEIPGARVVRVVGAKHFDFETDACGAGDFACTLCAPTGGEHRSLTLGLTTAALVWVSGADGDGQGWWKAGEQTYDQLIAEGRILSIK